MRLLEYQAKSLFGTFSIPVPRGEVVSSLAAATSAARSIGFPLVLKAQLPVGGRGKSGLVKVVRTPSELDTEFTAILGKSVQGLKVEKVLMEPFFAHESEMYVGYTENRSERCFSLVVSPSGGVDVEQVKEKFVGNFGLEGPSEETITNAVKYLNLPSSATDGCKKLIMSLYRVFDNSEAELAEINPLVYSSSGGFMALDAKLIIDDNALFRHPELKPYLPQDVSVEEAEKFGFNFVPLDGDVAVVGNGAGLVLATLDMVSSRGFTAACFLDLGGGASLDRVKAALQLLSTSLPNMKALFVNVFGGITNSVSVAEGFLDVKRSGLLTKPFFLRLSGAGELEARDLLSRNGINSFIDIEPALDALEAWGRS
jgi:succinyl-CoA synthetase beta subunit